MRTSKGIPLDPPNDPITTVLGLIGQVGWIILALPMLATELIAKLIPEGRK